MVMPEAALKDKVNCKDEYDCLYVRFGLAIVERTLSEIESYQKRCEHA